MLQSYDDAPTPESARIDRVKLSVKGWRVSYRDDQAFDDFVFALTSPSGVQAGRLIDSDNSLVEGLEDRGWIFNNRKNPSLSLTTLDVKRPRSSGVRGRMVGMPLFGGIVRFSRQRGELSGNRSVSSITLELSVNPTRFADRHPTGGPFFPYVPRGVSRSRYSSLDGNDNLMRPQALVRYDDDALWHDLLDLYPSIVIEAIQAEMERAAEVSECQFVATETRFSIRDVEIYWEKSSNDAIQELQSYIPALSQVGRASRVREYPSSETSREANCPSVSVSLAEGLTFRTYAKAFDRLRFEFSFNLKMFHRAASSADSLAEVNSRFHQLAEDASSRLVHLMGAMRQTGERSEAATLRGFLQKLHSSVHTADDAHQILAILIEFRCLARPSRKFDVVARRLRDEGVLCQSLPQGVTTPNPYTLTPEYLELFRSVFPLPTDSPSISPTV